mgnify:FL=1
MVRKEKPLERRGSNMPGRHGKKRKANGLTAKQRTLPKKLQQKILKSKARRKKR